MRLIDSFTFSFFHMENLSLGTFEPDRAIPPYLNTPRSLEACRRRGINPVELVEVPATEFKKEFPNDPDAAQRRYERIDGARRRVLKEVTAEWKRLVESGWKPHRVRPKSAKERILDVPEDIHSTLLEIQAATFRKIESDQFKNLGRSLAIQLKKADAEVKHKKILQKHEEIQNHNENTKKQQQLNREAIEKSEIEKKHRIMAEEAAELKRLREIDGVYALQKKKDNIERMLRDKQYRESREAERLQREAYTQRIKQSIIDNAENKINTKKRILEIRDKNIEDRRAEVKSMKEKEKADRSNQMQSKLLQAREDARRQEEEEQIEVCLVF